MESQDGDKFREQHSLCGTVTAWWYDSTVTPWSQLNGEEVLKSETIFCSRLNPMHPTAPCSQRIPIVLRDFIWRF